jgi:hypothetical protein
VTSNIIIAQLVRFFNDIFIRRLPPSLKPLVVLVVHKSSRITTHYSEAELRNLIGAENKVCIPGANLIPLDTVEYW